TNRPAANWFATSFNDASWPQARAKFGAGATSNIVTSLPQQKANYYFRRAFNVTNTDLAELLLAATCTDDYGGINYPLQVYLNGRAIPATAVELGTGTGNEVRYFDLTPFSDFVHTGSNTIALAIGNAYAPDWDNIAFDVALKTILAKSSLARISSIDKQSSAIRLGIDTPIGTVWNLESADRLGSTDWQTFETFTNTVSGTRYTLDTGQGGRSPPSSTALRFYRLTPF